MRFKGRQVARQLGRRCRQFRYLLRIEGPRGIAERIRRTAAERIAPRNPLIPVSRFSETMKAFGQWEMKGFQLLFYVLENEVHHRGQGYVYLRSLGIEPPAFYDREM